MSSARTRIAWWVVGVAVLAGCTSDGPDDGVSPTASAVEAAPPELLWSAHDVTLLGQPVVAGDVALAYVTDTGSDLALRAWDVTTGEQLWSDDASPGGGSVGTSLPLSTVTVDDATYVGIQTMTPDGVHFVTVRDVATGHEVELENTVISSPILGFFSRSRVWSCQDERAFCVQAALAPSGSWLTLRFDPLTATASEVPSTNAEIPANTRQVSDLWASNDRPPQGAEVLGRSVGGTVLWSHGYEDLLGPGASSDNGWNWAVDDDTDLVLGTVVQPEQDQTVNDLANDVTVALDGATGTVRWRQDGAVTSCDAADEFSTTHLWCRVRTGSMVFDGSGAQPGGPMDLSLEKFDPATGDVLWSAPLGDAPGAFGLGLTFTPTDDYRVLATADGAVRVRLDDGSVSPVAADEVLACARRPTFEFPANADPASATATYRGAPVVDLCLPDGTAATTATTALVTDVGVDAGDGIRLLATGAGLEAYRIP